MMYTNGKQTQQLEVADLLKNGPTRIYDMIEGRTVRIVYSDPPWNPGNEKWWRRHAGAEPPSDYNNLLDAWCGLVGSLQPQDVFCEQSINPKHLKLFMDAVERCKSWGLPFLEKWTVFYGSPGSRSCTRPNVLLHFGNEKLRGDPSGMSGEPMTACVFDALNLPTGSLVVDPCMGKGMTSRQAHRCGLNAVGTELNPARLAKTVQWLVKHGYSEVQS